MKVVIKNYPKEGEVMKASQELSQELKNLEEKRKNNEIGVREFYKDLLEILANLKDALFQENIDEKQIKKQIPLLLTFIELQVGELEGRGH